MTTYAQLLLELLASSPLPAEGYEPRTVGYYVMEVFPFAVLFIVVGGGIALVMAWQEWNRDRQVFKCIQELELPPSAKVLDRELQKLAARDPKFDRKAFEAQVGEVFSRVRKARADAAPLPRHEVSDGVWRRAVVERELELAQGSRLFHAQVRLNEATLVGAFSDAHFDALHVRVAWSSRPIEVAVELSAAEAEAKAARTPEQLHVEVWVFVRRPDAKTLSGEAAGKCPSCGAPYVGGAANFCTHCQAILNSGSYGWVLAQVMDYAVYRGPWRQFTGFDEMVTRDPGFSPETIEDRGALLFWKWLHARSSRSTDTISRLAAGELLDTLREEAVELVSKRMRRWVFDVKVAGVDLLLMELDSEENRDEVCLRVRWSGRVAQFQEDAPPHVPRSSYATVLTLVRKSGAQTDVKTGVSSDRCHSCRGANQDTEASSCAFCQAPFAPGEFDFVLKKAESFEAWMTSRTETSALRKAVEPFLPSFKFVDERTRLLRMMASLAYADGTVSREERALLKVCSRRWGIPFEEIRPNLEGAVPPLEASLKKGSWPARAFVEGLCDAAAIDGVIDRRERNLILKIAKHLGIEAPTQPAMQARADAVRRALRDANAD